jgi:hypothetical protein
MITAYFCSLYDVTTMNTDIMFIHIHIHLFSLIRRDQQYAPIIPLLYAMYWLLHVLAAACHHQGAY